VCVCVCVLFMCTSALAYPRKNMLPLGDMREHVSELLREDESEPIFVWILKTSYYRSDVVVIVCCTMLLSERISLLVFE
jgi:hypothetical protein